MKKLIYFIFLLSIILMSLPSFAQWRKKIINSKEGDLIVCYHKNGKKSSEEFRPKEYTGKGFAKVYTHENKLIFEHSTSRMHMITSVHFDYDENGAVKKIHISSHPDGGIQWSTEDIYLDSSGNITHRNKQESDTQGRYQITLPEDRKKIIQEYIVPNNDSIQFYQYKEEIDPTGSLKTIRKGFPEKKYALTEWTVAGKIIRNKIEFYKSEGIQVIYKAYYKNGKIESEITEDKSKTINKKWDENGILVSEEIWIK